MAFTYLKNTHHKAHPKSLSSDQSHPLFGVYFYPGTAPSGSTWYNDINPGNSVEGVVVFDIPKDQTPTTAELHDSSPSNGIKVSLN